MWPGHWLNTKTGAVNTLDESVASEGRGACVARVPRMYILGQDGSGKRSEWD